MVKMEDASTDEVQQMRATSVIPLSIVNFCQIIISIELYTVEMGSVCDTINEETGL